MHLTSLTLTGMDPHADPADLAALSRAFPGLDWGVRCTAQSRVVRDWTARLAAALETGGSGGVALHLDNAAGSAFWTALHAPDTDLGQWHEDLGLDAQMFHARVRRIMTAPAQATSWCAGAPEEIVHAWSEMHDGGFVIPATLADTVLARMLHADMAPGRPLGHVQPCHILDAPAAPCPAPIAGTLTGYALRLAPEDWTDALEKVAAAVGPGSAWIDLDISPLRANGRLDMADLESTLRALALLPDAGAGA